MPRGWPDWRQPVRSALQVEITTPADPGSNADVTVVVPAGERWRLILARCILTTSAAAANRFLEIELSIGTLPTVRFPSLAAQTANRADRYVWAYPLGGAYDGFNALTRLMPLPELYLGPGDEVGFVYANKDAGDRLSKLGLYYEVLR